MKKILFTGILLVVKVFAFTQPAIRLYNKGVQQAEKGNYEITKRFFTKALKQDHVSPVLIIIGDYQNPI